MRLEKPCENCGQPFFSYPSANQRFCSLKCRSAFRFNTGETAPGKQDVRFACRECGTAFGMQQSYLTEYHKKYGRDPQYCSLQCSALGRRKDADERNTFTCLHCGTTRSQSRKPGGRLYREQKYCDQACKVAHQSAKANERFQRGDYKRHIKRHGYVWISIPLLGRTGRKHIMEHRHVMEKSLGRPLHKDETVHHINGNRQDNRPENLELFSSRHGLGQRVVDKIDFALDMILLYPEFARANAEKWERVRHLLTEPALPPAPFEPCGQSAVPTDLSSRPTS